MTDHAPKFGRYVVLDELSASNGERTLIAYDPELDRKVGLKVFPVASASAQAWRRDRARILAGIVHPHVVRVHDVGAVEGRQFAARDFVDGCTVGPWLDRDEPSWTRVLEVFLAAGEGLAAAHDAGLAHGRFGFDALVVGDDEKVRVIDFLRTSPQLGPPPRPDDDRRDWAAALHQALWDLAPDDEEPISQTDVPRRVRRLVLDGLRDRPTHLTLGALVAALRSSMRQRKRLGVAAVLMVGAIGVSAAALVRPSMTPEARSWCSEGGERIAQIWNENTIERSRAAFLATGSPHADKAWRSVETTVEPFVAQWRLTQEQRCLAPEEEQSRRAAATVCLHRQLRALEAFVEALQTADDAMVMSATETAASLGSPAACGAGPDDAARYADIDLEQVMEIETALSRARVQHSLSHFEDSIAIGSRARDRAQALGLRALAGEADYGMALTRKALGQEDEAEQGLHAAFDAAVASGHHEIVARSAMELAMLLADQGRHDDARRWTEHAAAAVERYDTLPLRTRLANAEGLAAYRRGDQEEAREHYERSMDLAQQQQPPDKFARIQAGQALGNVLGRLGKNTEQIEVLEQSLAFARAELHPGHPSIGHHLNSLASALSHRGSIDLALATQQETLEIFEGAFGPDHANTIAARTTMAAILDEAGREKEAEEVYALALEAAERTFSDDDPRYVTVLGNIGMFHALQGEYVEAAALLAQAATRNEAIHGPDHEHTLGYLNNLAATYLFSDNLEDARRSYEEIVVRTERSLGAEHPQVVPALLGLARVQHLQGEPGSAVPRLERALELSIASDVRAERVGTVRFSLARALWDEGRDRERATAVGGEALQDYVTAASGGWDMEERLQEVRDWLAEHGGR